MKTLLLAVTAMLGLGCATSQESPGRLPPGPAKCVDSPGKTVLRSVQFDQVRPGMAFSEVLLLLGDQCAFTGRRKRYGWTYAWIQNDACYALVTFDGIRGQVVDGTARHGLCSEWPS